MGLTPVLILALGSSVKNVHSMSGAGSSTAGMSETGGSTKLVLSDWYAIASMMAAPTTIPLMKDPKNNTPLWRLVLVRAVRMVAAPAPTRLRS